MIEFVVAAALSCMFRDTPARIEAWLTRKGMQVAATARSSRFDRMGTLWLADDGSYALVMPDRRRTSCVVDMGRNWKKVG